MTLMSTTEAGTQNVPTSRLGRYSYLIARHMTASVLRSQCVPTRVGAHFAARHVSRAFPLANLTQLASTRRASL